jgi:hypothetical protein
MVDSQKPLIDRVLEGIQSDDAEEQARAVAVAGFLVEKALGRPDVGWDAEVARADVDSTTMSQIRDALVGFVESHMRQSPLSGAIGVLGLLEDRELVPLFRRCLKQYAVWNTHTGVLFQTMIALGNLAEPVFPSNSGGSITELRRNLELAHAYLDSIAKGAG